MPRSQHLLLALNKTHQLSDAPVQGTSSQGNWVTRVPSGDRQPSDPLKHLLLGKRFGCGSLLEHSTVSCSYGTRCCGPDRLGIGWNDGSQRQPRVARREATTTSVRSATHWRVSAGYLWHAQQAEHSPHGRPAHSGQHVDWFTTTAYSQARTRGQPPQFLELTASAALLVTGLIGVLKCCHGITTREVPAGGDGVPSAYSLGRLPH